MDIEPVYVVPNTVRDMARWLISTCVVAGGGGLITKGLKHSIDWITNPNIDFRNDDFRKWSNSSGFSVGKIARLYRRMPQLTKHVVGLATEMSFFSLYIWNPAGEKQTCWNCGDYSPWVGWQILYALRRARDAFPAILRQKKAEFVYRTEYISRAVYRMGDGLYNGWWDDPMISAKS